MASPPIWRPLPLPESSGMPVLLVSIVVEAAAYTVRVTDMANMWVESLDRKAICMRGWGENTTIDPSDTPENMTKFLASVRCAMDPSQPGHDQTTMSLTRASVSDAGEGGLTLRITCELPGLQALKWPIHLRKASSSALTTSFVLPLVQAQYSRAQELESLVAILGQKDAVLTKLVDKLEATGTGLENVFNSLSGKKKVSRAAAADKVKGLAPFDKRRWQMDVQREDGPDSTTTLVHEVFDADKVPHNDTPEIEDASKLDRWWLDLEGTLQLSRGSSQKAAREMQSRSLSPNRDTQGDGDDFQVQELPPHLESSSKHKLAGNKGPSADESTDSGDDDEPAPQRSPTKPKSGTSAPRLGAIGGKKKETRSSPKSEVNSPMQDIGTKGVAPEDSGDETASTVGSSPPSSPKKAIPTRGKLGRIGGSREAPISAKNDDGEMEEAEVKPPARAPKLGTIGGAKAGRGAAAPASKNGEERGRPQHREPSTTTQEQRETSTERADRRREQLKRDLEKKAAAGPVKKKRKF